jgi:hypothetical protein
VCAFAAVPGHFPRMESGTPDSRAMAPRPNLLVPAAIGLLAFLVLTVPFLGLLLIPAVGLRTAARILARTAPRSAA